MAHRVVRALACITFLLLFPAASEAAPAGTAAGILRVADDGTLALDTGERLRLLGVDLPRDPVAALKSRRILESMVGGKNVRVVTGEPREDAQGVSLAYIYLEDGALVNARLIKQGYAFAAAGYPFAKREEFRQYQRQARDAGAGVWAKPKEIVHRASDPAPSPGRMPAPASRASRSGSGFRLPVSESVGGRLLAATVIGFLSFYLLVYLVLLWKSEARADRLLAQLAMSGLGAVGLTLLLPLVFLLASESFEPSGGSWVAGVLTALGVLSGRSAARAWQRGQLLRGTPTTRLRSTSHGFCKARGFTYPAYGILRSGIGGIPCLYYSEVTEEYQRHTETYYDAQAKKTRTRVVYRWVPIHSATRAVNFGLNDNTATATVVVDGAQFFPAHRAFLYNNRPAGHLPWIARVGDIRTTVEYIAPETALTVWGRYVETGRESVDQVDRQIRYDEHHGCLVICEGNESRVYGHHTGAGLGLALLTAIIFLGVILLIAVPVATGF